MIEIKGNLILGIPKTGSQSLAAYIMGRQVPFTHKRYSEYNRSFFSVYALWRDPVERFKSALRFEKESVDKVLSVDDPSLLYKPQSYWLDEVPEDRLVLLPFSDFENSVKYIGEQLGHRLDFVPRIFKSEGSIELSSQQLKTVEEFYKEDYKYRV